MGEYRYTTDPRAAMPNTDPHTLGRLIHATARGHADAPSDAELLDAYATTRDPDASAALLARHGPMVWGVCRRTLAEADAEDAFQATFLVLVRKPHAVRPRHRLAAWLYGVASHASRKLRQANGRRARREARAVVPVEPSEPADVEWLHRELARLPEAYRDVVVRCEIEGQTLADAARALGFPPGTVASRLHRGRELLKKRLLARGLTAGTVASVLTPSVRAAPALSAEPSAVSQLLAREALAAMLVQKLRPWAAFVLATAGVGVALAAAPRPPLPVPVAVAPVVVETRQPPKANPFEARTEAQHLAITADGKRMVAWERSGTIRLLDMTTGLPVCEPLKFADLARVVLSPDGGWMVPVPEKAADALTAWSTATGERVLHLPRTPFDAVAVSPDHALVAVVNGTKVRLIDTSNGREVRAWVTAGASAVRFAADGKTMFTAARGAPVAAWDVGTGRPRFAVGVAGADAMFALSPDGAKVAWLGFGPAAPKQPRNPLRPNDAGELIFVADAGTGAVEYQIGTGRETVRELQFTRDAKMLVSRSATGMTVWNPDTGTMMISWWVTDDGFTSAALVPDADAAAVGTGKGAIRFKRVYHPAMPRFREKWTPPVDRNVGQPDPPDPVRTTHYETGDDGKNRTVKDADLAKLSAFTNLESLDLTCCYSLTDAAVEHFKGLKKLRALTVESKAITDRGARAIAGMTWLRSLAVDCPLVTDDGLKHLANCKDLETLSVEGAKATPALLEHLAGLTKLTNLQLRGVLTDDSVGHLRGLTALRELGDSDCRLSDAGLEALHDLKALRKVQLSGKNSAITPLGRLRLLRALPLVEME